jgi:hypothetical protein
MVSPEVVNALDSLPPSTHAMLVYDTKERKEEVLFEHLRLASKYDGAVFVCSEETPSQAETSMRSFGIDVNERKRQGTLLVKNFDDVYIVDGKVDSPRIIKGFSDLAYEYSTHGYGLRAAAEMSCFFRPKRLNELVAYENDLHRKFSFPAFGICGFNLLEMGNSNSLDVLWPIIRAHGVVIMTGPGGSLVLPPEEVKSDDVEKTMGSPKGSLSEAVPV